MGSILISPVQTLGYPFDKLNHEVVRQVRIGNHEVYAAGRPFLYADYDFVPETPLDAVLVWDPSFRQNGKAKNSVDEVGKLRQIALAHDVPLIGMMCDWFAAWNGGTNCWGTPNVAPFLDGIVTDPVGAAALRTQPFIKDDPLRRPIAELTNYLSYGRLPTLGHDEELVREVPRAHPMEGRDIDVCFVGYTHVDMVIHRAYFLEQVRRVCDKRRLRYQIGYGIKTPDMEKLLLRSKVCFNTSVGSALNMRVYEAAAAGCNLLTDRHNQGNGDISHFAEFYSCGEDIDHALWTMLDSAERLQRRSEIATGFALRNSPMAVWSRVIDAALSVVEVIGDSWRDRPREPVQRLTKKDVKAMVSG